MSIFAMRDEFWENAVKTVEKIHSNVPGCKVKLYDLADKEKFYQEMDYAGGSAFLIGNEARGLRQETAECADCFLRIPMEGELESLNAAVAAALLMYQSRFEKK